MHACSLDPASPWPTHARGPTAVKRERASKANLQLSIYSSNYPIFSLT